MPPREVVPQGRHGRRREAREVEPVLDVAVPGTSLGELAPTHGVSVGIGCTASTRITLWSS